MLMLMIQIMMIDNIGDNDDDDNHDSGVDYDAFVEHFTALWLQLDAAARKGLN